MAKRWKVRRRRVARLLMATTGNGNGDGNGNGNGNGNGDGNGNGNGNGNGGEGVLPEIPETLPDPPPGVFEAPTVDHPIMKIDEELKGILPVGGVWPRPEGEIKGTFLVLAAVPNHGWRYVVVDPDAIKHAEPAPLRK